MKQLKDYLHFYLGCEVLINDFVITGTGETGIINNNHIGTLTTVSILGTKQRFRVLIKGTSVERYFNLETDKPILRPLSDMTEEEIKDFIGWDKLNEIYCDISFIKDNNGISINYGIDTGEYIDRQHHYISFYQFSPREWIWLLSKHIDLFGLIEAGLAIDKTTLQSNL